MNLKLWTVVLILVVISRWSHQVYDSKQLRHWQAHRGSETAQYQLANQYWQQSQRTAAHYWWLQAGKQHYYPAIESLRNSFPQASSDWLKLAAEAGDLTAKRRLATAELANTNISIDEWGARWSSVEDPWLQRQVSLLQRYQSSRQCDIAIKVIAADRSEKRRYLSFLDAVKDSVFNSDNWCISWTLDKNLSCVTSTERNRASCKSSALESGQKFDKRVILAGQGIASADNSTLTLTPGSSKKVIQHELGHWMGFADEYEMSASLARGFCHGNYDHDSLNIVVTGVQEYYSAAQVKSVYHRLPWKNELNSWQDIATQNGNKWRLGSPEGATIGLFKADSCNAITSRQAWRPVNVSTAMEQHDTGLWPALYLKLYNTLH